VLIVNLPPRATVEQFTLSADQTVAVFGITAGTQTSLAAAYAARLDGAGTWQVLGGGGIVEFRMLADGRLLYQVDHDRDGYAELYIAPLGSP